MNIPATVFYGMRLGGLDNLNHFFEGPKLVINDGPKRKVGVKLMGSDLLHAFWEMDIKVLSLKEIRRFPFKGKTASEGEFIIGRMKAEMSRVAF